MRRIATCALFPLLLAACSAAQETTGTSTPSPPESSTGASNGPGSADAQAPPSGATWDDAASPVGSSEEAGSSPVDGGGGGPSPADDAGPSSNPVTDATTGAAPDATSGPPVRNGTCTPLSQQTGTAADTTHGRLDGTLVYVLPIDGSSACNGDSAHVHLQIEVSGSIYDVAVDVGKSGDEVAWYQQTIAAPGGPWAEGWHGSDSLGYSSIGLTSSAFATLAPAAMGAEVESLLSNTSKISIYCTGYTPGDNGCHDVHYQNGSSQDGAIVIDPTAATPTLLFFRFASDSF